MLLRLYNSVDESFCRCYNKTVAKEKQIGRLRALIRKGMTIRMKKSVYSLVLTDAVVDAVDRLAASNRTSRSNMINRILAEHLSFQTPEMRIRDIFKQLEQLMDGAEMFQMQPQPSESMLSVRSSLKYKYKPTVRYSVELLREPSESFGVLKVSFRTQNPALTEELERFFVHWAELEKKYLSGRYQTAIRYTLDGGRFSRSLMLPPESAFCESDVIGLAIYQYISTFDNILKKYFQLLEHRREALIQTELSYRSALERGKLLI